MKKIEVLHQNKWVSLLKMVWPEKNVSGYVYSHETRCNGHIISVLPFRRIEISSDYSIRNMEEIRNRKFEFLLREEITPCWDVNRPALSSITGGVEKGLSPEEIAVEEIDEEAGYIVEESELIDLGTCRGTKSSDTIYHLFGIDLTGREKLGEAEGDGSELERLAQCVWYGSDRIGQAEDPFVYVSYYRLREKGVLR